MLRIAIAILCALSVAGARADLIVTREGGEIECKVEKISSTDLSYRIGEQRVVRIMPVSDILFVKYDNGEKEFFNRGEQSSLTQPASTSYEDSFFPIQLPLTIPTDYSRCPGASRRYDLYDYYDENGVRGIVIEVTPDGRHGKVLSLHEIKLGNFPKFKGVGESMSLGNRSYYDGESNTALFIAKLTEIGQRLGCRQKLVDEIAESGEGWYIPAYGEIFKLFSELVTPTSSDGLKRINKILKSHDGKKIDRYANYNSSTEGKYMNQAKYFSGCIKFEKETLGKTDSMTSDWWGLDNRGINGRIRLFHKF